MKQKKNSSKTVLLPTYVQRQVSHLVLNYAVVTNESFPSLWVTSHVSKQPDSLPGACHFLIHSEVLPNVFPGPDLCFVPLLSTKLTTPSALLWIPCFIFLTGLVPA